MAKAEKAAPAVEEKKSKVTRGVVAKKPDEDKAERAERARKYPDTMKIKILNKENPHREGSGRAAAFTALLASKTVGDYYATGHKTKYLKDWAESKHIEELGGADAA